MKKNNNLTPKHQMIIFGSSKLQACQITKQAQLKIKGGTSDSIIIEDDMVI